VAAASSDPFFGTTLRILEQGDAGWERFVDGRDGALPFHRWAWLEVLAESYGFRPFAAVVEGPAGGPGAGLPLMEVRDRIRGRRWIALPFTDRCPVLACSAAAADALADALATGAGEEGIGLEVRSRLGGGRLATGVVAVRHELDLTPGYEAVERGFSPMTRRNVRKATLARLQVRLAESEDDVARVFYGLQVRTRRRLGVPVQPRRLFRMLWKHGFEQGLGYALLVLSGEHAVAGAVFLVEAGTVVYKYGASDERAWSLRPNNLLFAEAIRRACEEGRQRVDLGRSHVANEGLRAFKAGWGAVEEPLVYTRLGTSPGIESPSRPLRLAGGLIRRAPSWLGRGVGESLYRYAA
jgi:CelD/BcsL family acetyltransferase involved in cellulose biosynthesis